MWVALSVAVLASGTPSEAAWIWAGAERAPFGLLVISSSADVVGLRTAEVVAAFSEALERDTGYRVRVDDAETAMTACAGDIACLATRARKSKTDVFAILSNVPNPDGSSSVTATLVETGTSAATMRITRAGTQTVDSPENAQVYLGSLARHAFRGPLEASGTWRPRPWIQVSAPIGTVSALSNLEPVTLADGPVRYYGVDVGEHVLHLSRDGFYDDDLSVNVTGEDVLELSPEFESIWSGSRPAVAIGGSAVAIAGLALAIYGIAQASTTPNLVVICPATVNCKNTPAFTTLDGSNGEPGSVLTAPLGYSLFIAGASPSLASVLGRQRWAPWAGVAVGIVAGAAAYAVSTVLQGKTVTHVR